MHDATRKLLSKIEVGQTILTVPGTQTHTFEFGRPKDKAATPSTVTGVEKVRDQWTGHTYVVTTDDGRKNVGRYGTTHVYVTEAKPDLIQVAKESGKLEIIHVTEPEPPKGGPFASEVELDLVDSGTRRVVVEPGGTMRVTDWNGGDVTERTPKGRLVHITADGILTLVEDFPEGDEAPAPAPAEDVDWCRTCKGYGVVRKAGPRAGDHYRTRNGAAKATSSMTCPTCNGAELVSA